MQTSLKIVIGVILVTWGTSAHTDDGTLTPMKDRTLYIRSLPGYPGVRSDLYEVYMEPYFFPIELKAVIELKALGKDGSIIDGPRGNLMLEQHFIGVRITGAIMGLSPGVHGFHIHEKGDLRGGCDSSGSHFNPDNVSHGAPSDIIRHAGDLGNIEAGSDGIAHIDIMDRYMSLIGARGVAGRTLVVHAKPDDLGRGGTDESLKTGSSGARLACGIIGLL